MLVTGDARPPENWTGREAPLQGTVLVPDHIDPTNPRRVYDLDEPAECKYLYAIVLADGTEADINRLIARTLLAELWDGLYLPEAVRAAWAETVDTVRAEEHDEPAVRATRQVGPFRHPASTPVTPARYSPPRRAVSSNAVYGNSGRRP